MKTQFQNRFRNGVVKMTVALALTASAWASAGIKGYVYVYNQTGRIIEVQVNGRWRGAIDPNDSATYNVGDSAEKTTELYAEDASTGYYWSRSVSSDVQDYEWYVHD